MDPRSQAPPSHNPGFLTTLSVKDRPQQQHLEVQVVAREGGSRGYEELVNLKDGIYVTGFWSARTAGYPLAAMHVVAPSGPGWFIHFPPSRELTDQWACLNDLHTECLTSGRSMVVPLGNQPLELHLVAVKDGPSAGPEMRAGRTLLCCFWCFLCPQGSAILYRPFLESERVSVVLDLDETLVQALTLSGFAERLEIIKKDIHKELDPHKRALVEEDRQRLEADYEMLREFSERNTVSAGGRTWRHQQETRRGGASVPVIRLPPSAAWPSTMPNHQLPPGWGGPKIFTRVHPESPHTSMLIHVNAGWEMLRAQLAQKHPARSGSRYEISVCTLSENSYALEIVSLLDPEGLLIDPGELERRVVCVPSTRQKTLECMLQAKVPKNLAVVVDDRPLVWQDEDRAQVLPVLAFHPYRRMFSRKADPGAVDSLEMVAEVLKKSHTKFYHALRKVFEPSANKAHSSLLPADLPAVPVLSEHLASCCRKSMLLRQLEMHDEQQRAFQAAQGLTGGADVICLDTNKDTNRVDNENSKVPPPPAALPQDPRHKHLQPAELPPQRAGAPANAVTSTSAPAQARNTELPAPALQPLQPPPPAPSVSISEATASAASHAEKAGGEADDLEEGEIEEGELEESGSDGEELPEWDDAHFVPSSQDNAHLQAHTDARQGVHTDPAAAAGPTQAVQSEPADAPPPPPRMVMPEWMNVAPRPVDASPVPNDFNMPEWLPPTLSSGTAQGVRTAGSARLELSGHSTAQPDDHHQDLGSLISNVASFLPAAPAASKGARFAAPPGWLDPGAPPASLPQGPLPSNGRRQDPRVHTGAAHRPPGPPTSSAPSSSQPWQDPQASGTFAVFSDTGYPLSRRDDPGWLPSHGPAGLSGPGPHALAPPPPPGPPPQRSQPEASEFSGPRRGARHREFPPGMEPTFAAGGANLPPGMAPPLPPGPRAPSPSESGWRTAPEGDLRFLEDFPDFRASGEARGGGGRGGGGRMRGKRGHGRHGRGRGRFAESKSDSRSGHATPPLMSPTRETRSSPSRGGGGGYGGGGAESRQESTSRGDGGKRNKFSWVRDATAPPEPGRNMNAVDDARLPTNLHSGSAGGSARASGSAHDDDAGATRTSAGSSGLAKMTQDGGTRQRQQTPPLREDAAPGPNRAAGVGASLARSRSATPPLILTRQDSVSDMVSEQQPQAKPSQKQLLQQLQQQLQEQQQLQLQLQEEHRKQMQQQTQQQQQQSNLSTNMDTSLAGEVRIPQQQQPPQDEYQHTNSRGTKGDAHGPYVSADGPASSVRPMSSLQDQGRERANPPAFDPLPPRNLQAQRRHQQQRQQQQQQHQQKHQEQQHHEQQQKHQEQQHHDQQQKHQGQQHQVPQNPPQEIVPIDFRYEPPPEPVTSPVDSWHAGPKCTDEPAMSSDARSLELASNDDSVGMPEMVPLGRPRVQPRRDPSPSSRSPYKSKGRGTGRSGRLSTDRDHGPGRSSGFPSSMMSASRSGPTHNVGPSSGRGGRSHPGRGAPQQRFAHTGRRGSGRHGNAGRGGAGMLSSQEMSAERVAQWARVNGALVEDSRSSHASGIQFAHQKRKRDAQPPPQHRSIEQRMSGMKNKNKKSRLQHM